MSTARARNSESREKIALVAGVGSSSGLGAALARRLAREGLLVFVAGRTEERLEKVAAEIIAARGKAVAVAADVTSEKDVIRLLSRAEESGSLDLVVYNAGGNATSSLLQLKRSEFESLWKQSALGGFLVGREAIRRMLPQRKGTLIFTGATASVRARPPFTAFASAKAALRAVAQGFAREFGPQGIHVAHVIIDGVIRGDYAQTQFAELTRSKGEDGLLEPDAIADAYWALHRQTKTAWTHELDLAAIQGTFLTLHFYATHRRRSDMSLKKVFLYAEIQVAIPFTKIDWASINTAMKKEKGLKSKTWLSGINNNTIGGFYEFDSLENAKAYAEGYLAAAARHLGGSLSVKLFDGDVVADASRGISSPYYEKAKQKTPALAK